MSKWSKAKEERYRQTANISIFYLYHFSQMNNFLNMLHSLVSYVCTQMILSFYTLHIVYSDQKGSYRHYLNSQCTTTTTTNIQHYLNSSLFQSDALCVEHSSRPNGGIWQYYDQDLFLRDPSVSVSCFKEGYLDGKRPHYMRSYYYLLHIIEHLVLISKSLVLGWQYLCR